MGDNERLTLSIEDGAKTLCVSERTLRELISRGEIPFVRIGRRVLLVKSQLERWLAEQAATVA